MGVIGWESGDDMVFLVLGRAFDETQEGTNNMICLTVVGSAALAVRCYGLSNQCLRNRHLCVHLLAANIVIGDQHIRTFSRNAEMRMYGSPF